MERAPANIQRRAKNPKVRTGCASCKIRRVKCDESKPICRRCYNADRDCQYIAPGPVVLRPRGPRPGTFVPILKGENREVPSSQTIDGRRMIARVNRLTPQNPTVSIRGSPTEIRYFHIFRSHIDLHLSFCFSQPFWTSLVLRESHEEPVIKHSIVALSALCEAMTAGSGNKEHLRFALAQQSKAVSSLRRFLAGIDASDRGHEKTMKLAVIACLMFAIFESICGDVKMVLMQLASGVQLLRTWRADVALAEQRARLLNPSHEPPKPKTEIPHDLTIEEELPGILARMELQVLTYRAMNPSFEAILPHASNEDEAVAEIAPVSIPACFTTLQEILSGIFKVSYVSLQHYRSCVFHIHRGKTAPPSPTPDPLAYAALEKNQATILAGISAFKTAIAPTFAAVYLVPNDPRHLAALQLDVNIALYKILMLTSLDDSETAFDSHRDAFQYVVDRSREIFRKDNEKRAEFGKGLGVAGEGEQPEKVEKVRLQFMMGPIFPLFFVATRCRDAALRVDAIELLRTWGGRSGVWDGQQAASVAGWVRELEMEGGDGGVVPQERRVRTWSLEWVVDGESGKIRVECLQGNGRGGLRTRGAILLSGSRED